MSKGHTWVLLAVLCGGGAAVAKDRVANARAERGEAVRAMFAQKGVPYPAPEIFLRAFKKEGELELWAGRRGEPLVLVKTFEICMSSGALGPKRELGDGQVPEGFYVIDRFNPTSHFHLSLGLDYPNASDRLRGTPGRLGGAIFIHGSCVTIGCLPIRDGPIEELYLAALDARVAGLAQLPVHVFPSRMDSAAMARLRAEHAPDEKLWAFWQELQPGYAAFEETRRVPRVTVHPKTGAYQIRPRPKKAAAAAGM